MTYVVCLDLDCACGPNGTDVVAAIAAWNHRPIEDAQAACIAELKQRLAAADRMAKTVELLAPDVNAYEGMDNAMAAVVDVWVNLGTLRRIAAALRAFREAGQPGGEGAAP